ncbi:TIGR03809 family protein [Tardiphaga sp. 813_E8_N1_3]|uniref:TIGR03809 family protein n=1 Tax=Tardiphaga sp. 813_E8_N1_3 TaxID=3240760 RepID=UPI003F1F48E7
MSSHLNFPYPHAGIGRPLAQRWCALAESRLEYLTELFESGRWRRFHSEAEFLDNIQEAKEAVERWRLMVEGETAAVRRVLSSEGVIYRAPRAPEPRPAAVVTPAVVAPVIAAPAVAPLQPDIEPVAEAASPVLIPIETLLRQAPPRQATVTPADLDWQKALDPLVISARYPMLRTAL